MSDIIATINKVVRNRESMPEDLQLAYLKEIGITHMRIVDGVESRLQLYGMLAKLCRLKRKI